MAKKFSLRKNKKAIVAVGVGVAAAAAAAAGAYFFSGKRGARNRKKVKAWMLKAKADVLEALERAKDLNWQTYNAAVNKVMRRYQAMKDVSARDVAALMGELKGHWKSISRDIKHAGTSVARRVASKVRRKRN